jgi:hypothetical protein
LLARRPLVALRGSFTETEPGDLLQILSLGGKTGTLTVFEGDQTTKMAFRDGEIIDAFDGVRRGEEIVFAVLTLRAGSFTFGSEAVSAERTIHRTVPALLLAAARRADDMTRAKDLLARPSARVYLPQAIPAGELIEGAERQVLELVDGRRSVGEIAAASDLEASRAYAALASLLERGLVAVVTAQDDSSPLLGGPMDAATDSSPDALGPDRDIRPPTPDELREVIAHLQGAARCLVERGAEA